MDVDAAQCKEVFAEFGLALYFAQCIERQLAIDLATAYGPGPRRITRSQFDRLLQSFFDKTLGGLVQTLRKSVAVSPDMEARLQDALQKRNWLAHHYFWERAEHFMTRQGRGQMIDELQVIIDQFQGLDRDFTQISRKWARKIGLSPETLCKELEGIVAEAREGNPDLDEDLLRIGLEQFLQALREVDNGTAEQQDL